MVNLEIIIKHDGEHAFTGIIALPPAPCLPHKSLESLYLTVLISPEHFLESFLLPFLESCSKHSFRSVLVPGIGTNERICSALADLGFPL